VSEGGGPNVESVAVDGARELGDWLEAKEDGGGPVERAD